MNQLAHHQIHKMTMEDSQPVFYPPTQADISAVMAELGRRGGKIGGKRRAKKMTPEERSNAAAVVARAMWKKQKGRKSGS